MIFKCYFCGRNILNLLRSVMYRLLLFSCLFLGVLSCSQPKKPVFKAVSSIEIKKLGLKNVTVQADALFENPNALSGTLSLDDIHIFVNDLDVGTISSQTFEVPSHTEFTIPIQGSFSFSDIYAHKKQGLLNSILATIQTDSIHIQYKGAIRYHLGSFSYPYKIDTKQSIALKTSR